MEFAQFRSLYVSSFSLLIYVQQRPNILISRKKHHDEPALSMPSRIHTPPALCCGDPLQSNTRRLRPLSPQQPRSKCPLLLVACCTGTSHRALLLQCASLFRFDILEIVFVHCALRLPRARLFSVQHLHRKLVVNARLCLVQRFQKNINCLFSPTYRV